MVQYPSLKHEEIENRAANLLLDYERENGKIKNPAIPIKEIIETHLELAICTMSREDDILGSINIYKKEIHVNEHLYPDDPSMRAGRYHFTLGHEVGHWILHAPILKANQHNHSSFGSQDDSQQSIFCRNSSKDMIETQADYFSSPKKTYQAKS